MSERSTSTRSSRLWFWLPILAGVIIFSAVGLIFAVLTFGRVSGEEFSADDFRRREFTYYQIPIVAYQVRPTHHRDTTPPIRSFLTANGHLPKKDADDPEWDLVYDNTTKPNSPVLDASILCGYLDQVDSEFGNYWTNWSTDNKPLANELWPIVVELARLGEYLLMPDIFRAAERNTDPNDLRDELVDICFGYLIPKSELLVEDGDASLAVDLCDFLLDLDPSHEKAAEIRDLAAKKN